MNGIKYFIFYVDIVGFVIVFMVIGEEDILCGKKKLIMVFFVDKGMSGFMVCEGYCNVFYCGYINQVLEFDDCCLFVFVVLGEVYKGF